MENAETPSQALYTLNPQYPITYLPDEAPPCCCSSHFDGGTVSSTTELEASWGLGFRCVGFKGDGAARVSDELCLQHP